MLRWTFVFVLLISALPALPQRSRPAPATSRNTTDISISVTYEDGPPVPMQTQVTLVTGSGIPVQESFTDDSGRARFAGVQPGTYGLRVRDFELEETGGRNFNIEPGEGFHYEMLVVKRKPNRDNSQNTSPQMIAVVDMNVPDNAAREFHKGMEELREKKLGAAEKHFHKAIEKHAQYASAYNALGVAYMMESKADAGHEAFLKALSLNDHFALAQINLAKYEYTQGRFAGAEDLLKKSLGNDPNSAEALTILSQIQLKEGRFDEALVNARKVHSLTHDGFSIAHFVAARALRAKQLWSDAMVEYNLFLKETPNGPTAEHARQELAALQKSNH